MSNPNHKEMPLEAAQKAVEAIMRNRRPHTGPKRDAFEEYREWLIKEMEPAITRLCDRKLREVARAHGVTEGEMLALINNPPASEHRRQLMMYVYELLMG